MTNSVQIIHKAAPPLPESAPGELETIPFVLSTEDKDLMDDVIVQKGITPVSSRVPAQVDHSGQVRDIVGNWENIRTVGKRTLADLRLLPKGISPIADLVRAISDAGIRLAASVGLRIVKAEPIKESKKGGIRYLETLLTEASVVVVPAHPEALQVVRSLLPKGSPESKVLSQLVKQQERKTDELLNKRLPPGVRPNSLQGIVMKTIAEQILAEEAALEELRNEQTETVKKLTETEDEGEITSLEEAGAALAEQIDKKIKRIDSLKNIEKSLAPRQGTRTNPAPAVVNRNNIVDRKPDGNDVIRSALLCLESHVKRLPLEEVIKARYGDNEQISVITKAAQNPAMTSVPEWAGALVRDTYGAFMDMLAVASVIPQIPMQKYDFGNFHSIKIARRTSRPPTDPNLASAFRGEGAPIRVGAVSLASDSLTPKTAGVIGTFTMELFEQSTPNIETEIRKWIIEDTAVAFDLVFLSANAASAISPGGIRAGQAAGDTAASTGNSPAQITADIRARAQQLAANGLGFRPVWIMDPARKVGLELSTTAAGSLAFPSVSANNTLLGYPIITSLTVPDDIVYLVDAEGLAYAGGAPQFLASEVATIHEEGATPLPLVTGAQGAGVAASPQRSLYQTYSSALRGIYKVDWKVVRPGSVQTITGVAW